MPRWIVPQTDIIKTTIMCGESESGANSRASISTESTPLTINKNATRERLPSL